MTLAETRSKKDKPREARARQARTQPPARELEIMNRGKGRQAMKAETSKRRTREKASQVRKPIDKRKSAEATTLKRNGKSRLARVQPQVVTVILIKFLGYNAARHFTRNLYQVRIIYACFMQCFPIETEEQIDGGKEREKVSSKEEVKDSDKKGGTRAERRKLSFRESTIVIDDDSKNILFTVGNNTADERKGEEDGDMNDETRRKMMELALKQFVYNLCVHLVAYGACILIVITTIMTGYWLHMS
ncbi:hypothetical protein WH47_01185 [Habropoda laboriosa]|uniref:Uncharacterized protein n=1 Tax=Habropoda laboriosa TaxID=597456 RepID=A0A0L7QZ23_9HYME|nr:hypothetical protein WH47_01185 [Habropoda laboriosa]